MRPVLYKPDATDFAGNGFGALNMAVRCEVTENLGDAPTLEMDIFISDPLFKNIVVGSIIGAIPNKTDPKQAFIVEQITKPINGISTIYAVHIAQHRAKLIPVAPFTALHVQTALDALNSNAMETSPFTFHRTGANTTATMTVLKPTSMRELMGGSEGSIVDLYGGEWGYNNFDLTLNKPRRGRDNGVRVVYGKNMTDIKLEEQFGWDSSVTGAVGYWLKDDVLVVGSPQYSEYASNYPYNKTVAVDLTEKFEEQPSVAQLNTEASSWISGRGLTSLTMEVAFDHLQLEGESSIALGDTVQVLSGQYNFSAKRRIVGMVFDVLADEYKTVTIGALKTTINQAISGVVSSSVTSGSKENPSRLFYGECDSNSTSTVFTAQIPGIKSYYDGLAVLLKNGVVTSASGFTININGLGAKPCYNNMATGNDSTPTAPTRDTTIFNINYTMLLIYVSDIVSGGGWICYRGYDANTNTIGYQLRTNSRTMPVNGATYRYRLLFTSQTGIRFIPANTSTSTNATAIRAVNQTPINPFGEIIYYGGSAAVASGNNPSATALWEQYVITLGYSFNRTGAALTLSPNTPVYIKCSPQSDGSAIIDPNTPYVQVLPTSADGKIYIFLGTATSATQVELVVHHPVFYHTGTALKLWTGG